jgi:hypothetical protein
MMTAGGRRSRRGALATGLNAALAAFVSPTNPEELRKSGRKVEGFLNVCDFGARGDGKGDDGNALKACLESAIRGRLNNPLPIYLPPGEYLIKSSRLLNLGRGGFVQNLRVTGAGWAQTAIRFRPETDGDHWLYDGSSSTGDEFQILWPTFENISWTCDDSGIRNGSVNLFRLNPGSKNPAQNFKFLHCYFDGPKRLPGTLLQIEGRVCGSENRFLLCRGRWWTRILHLNNPQAVNHDFISCDFELLRGTAFEQLSGGQINVIGGSYILGHDEHTSPYADSLATLVSQLAGRDGLTGALQFCGVRTELRGAGTGVLSVSGVNNRCMIAFRSCNFDVVTGPRRDVFVLESGAPYSVDIDGCSLATHIPVSVRFSGGNGPQTNSATIRFSNSVLRPELLEDVFQGGSVKRGQVQLTNCTLTGNPERRVGHLEHCGVLEVPMSGRYIANAGALTKEMLPKFSQAGTGIVGQVCALPQDEVLLSATIWRAAAGTARDNVPFQLVLEKQILATSTFDAALNRQSLSVSSALGRSRSDAPRQLAIRISDWGALDGQLPVDFIAIEWM